METLTVKSSVKSAEVYRNGVVKTADESAAEVLHVDDTSGVYKMLMVRMSLIGLTNLRMYGSKSRLYRNVQVRATAIGVV